MTETQTPSPPRARRRAYVRPVVHALVLASFAVAQPLFDLLGRNATFFVAHRAGALEIIVFALAALLIPTFLALLLPAVILPFSRQRARDALHVMIGLLFALVIVPPLSRAADMRTLVAFALLLALTVLGALAYRRIAGVRRLLTIAAPAPLLFAALFLLGSQVRNVMFPNDPVVVASNVEGKGSPIVFLQLDEFAGVSIMNPDGTLDRETFPNLGRLADTSTWYPNATAVHYATDRAAPSIVSGVLPKAPKVPNYADHPQTIFTLLGGRYEVHGYETVTQLCPPSVCGATASGPERGLLAKDIQLVALHLLLPPNAADRWLGPLGDRWAGFGAQTEGEQQQPAGGPPRTTAGLRNLQAYNERVRYFEHFISTIRAPADRTLWYLHVLMPHEPWRYLPNGQRYEREGKRLPGWKTGPWGPDTYLSHQGLQRYVLQAQLTDRLLGRLMDKMQDAGVFDDAIFVTLADHGVAFYPNNPRRGVTELNKEQIVPVPLFVKLPGQKQGRVDRRNAQTVDVLPTIASALGIEIPWKVDGRPLNEPDPKVPRKFFGGQDGDLELPAVMPGLRQAAAEMRRWFGGSFRDLYRYGPNTQLLRKQRSQLSIAPAAPGSVSLELPDNYRRVDVQSDFIPARFTARATPDLRPGTAIAVVLNGTVAGVGQIYGPSNAPEISVMLEPRWFRDGKQTVEVFTVDRSMRLHPIAIKNYS